MIKPIIKKAFARLGYQIIRTSAFDAVSDDPFQEMRRLFASTPVTTIFDVGAHHGHVSLSFRRLFPHSTVYAFEPFPESFERLSRNTAADPLIQPLKFGLADVEGARLFSSNASSATNSLFESDNRGAETWGPGLLETDRRISLPFSTIDRFVVDRNIRSIDILKLDVQGAEYLVLKGAEQLLAQSRIKLIYSEVITQPTYRNQEPLHQVLRMFHDYGFLLHNVYALSRTSEGKLRQFDAIFTLASRGADQHATANRVALQ